MAKCKALTGSAVKGLKTDLLVTHMWNSIIMQIMNVVHKMASLLLILTGFSVTTYLRDSSTHIACV